MREAVKVQSTLKPIEQLVLRRQDRKSPPAKHLDLADIERAAKALGFDVEYDGDGGLALKGIGCSLYANHVGRFTNIRWASRKGNAKIQQLYAALVAA